MTTRVVYGGKIKVCKCGVGFITTGRRHAYCTKECWKEFNPQREYDRMSKRRYRAARRK